ncbi:MAG: hypothetical protein ACFB16_17695 [Phormidesmis sp.]
MRRFILSTFSVLLATAAVSPTVQALPEAAPTFKLQTLRLNELEVRNKSEESTQPYYSQPYSQDVPAEQEETQTAESTGWQSTTEWEAPAAQPEDASTALSVTERRHQLLDRN